MKGFPEYFNIKQDVFNTLTEYPIETKAYLQKLLDERFNWLPTKTQKQEFTISGKALSFNSAKKLDKGEIAVIDETHREVKIEDDRTKEVIERYQEEYKEDPNCKLFRLGFTVKEVEGILNTKELSGKM
jgi:hypothetical protein